MTMWPQSASEIVEPTFDAIESSPWSAESLIGLTIPIDLAQPLVRALSLIKLPWARKYVEARTYVANFELAGHPANTVGKYKKQQVVQIPSPPKKLSMRN